MRYLPGEPAQGFNNQSRIAGYQARNFLFAAADGVATITLNRPERKNPLTFDSYAELRELFRAMAYAEDV
ncbi:MAG: enoyl-CoA hydratase, partial [Lysobacteraceae bacterium]